MIEAAIRGLPAGIAIGPAAAFGYIAPRHAAGDFALAAQ